MKNIIKKTTCGLVFLANIGIIIFIWWSQSGGMLLIGQAGVLIALGRLTGLLAVYFVLWQLILIGRIKPIEQLFGLDRLAIFHHFNGLLAWILILLHPIFLVLGYGQVNGNSVGAQISSFLFSGESLAPAFFSAFLFVVVIVLSYGAIKKRLKYEVWYYIHLLTYLAIILAFNHQLRMGGDLQTIFANAYWSLLYLVVVAALVFYRFLVPAYLFYRHRFTVDQVIAENDQVVSIYIKGKNLDKFSFRAGQFAIFRFFSGRLVFEAHPFSFSRPLNEGRLRITVKNLGDFSGSLRDNLKVGALVLIDGPHGIFTVKRTKNKSLALIAGGIGITPLRSIVEKEVDRDMVLFFGVQKQADLVFLNEINGLARPNLRFIPLISGEENWSGERGRLDEEKIIRLLPDYLKRDFFLCGPHLMTKGARQVLHKLGVKNSQVYFEKFSLS